MNGKKNSSLTKNFTNYNIIITNLTIEVETLLNKKQKNYKFMKNSFIYLIF